MAIFRIPLIFNKKISFWKLLGCGRNGTFDIIPDWQQWCVLRVHSDFKQSQFLGNFINKWYKFFKAEVFTIVLKTIEGHGTWDKFEFFTAQEKRAEYTGPIAVLTRASIKISKLKSFWKSVKPIAKQMNASEGFIFSVGLGEIPLIKQATLSFWQSKNHMQQFAYNMHVHKAVVKLTHKEKWYSEEMFVRFEPISSIGLLNGKNPLNGIC